MRRGFYMPELPEIETMKRSLAPRLTGRVIQKVRLLREDVIHHPGAADFAARLTGGRIAKLSRRGKYLCLHLEDGQTLVAHMRMTGRLIVSPPGDARKPHTHGIFSLDDGQELRYSDTRRFGCLWLLAKAEPDLFTGMARLGVEPLSKEFNADYLTARLGSRRGAVKGALLDQQVIAGLGNIYVDETLFAAGIHPARPCRDLDEKAWEAIAAAVPRILQSAIEHNGTTFQDFLDGAGREGGNLPFLQAYGRYGLACPRCGALMQRGKIGGRGSCFCPVCQK